MERGKRRFTEIHFDSAQDMDNLQRFFRGWTRGECRN